MRRHKKLYTRLFRKIHRRRPNRRLQYLRRRKKTRAKQVRRALRRAVDGTSPSRTKRAPISRIAENRIPVTTDLPSPPSFQLVTERFYVVDERPQATEGHLLLADGSAVICSVIDEATALSIVAGERRLGIRRHTDLSKTERRRVMKTI